MKSETIFEFIRYSMDDSIERIENGADIDWDALYDFSKKHTLTGVMYHGLERLKAHPQEDIVLPDKRFSLKWYMQSEKIRDKNSKLSKGTVAIYRKLCRDGFRCTILKGQGIAQLYPNPGVRVCGDVDIWVDADRDRILEYVNGITPGQQWRYIHIDFPLVKGMPVEIHSTPSYMYFPLANRRLQQWFSSEADTQFANRVMLPGVGEISSPTLAFNRIFILSHIYKHLFSEGVGLRQLMDYYYVLVQGFTAEENRHDCDTLRKLGMMKIAGAVMFVLCHVFGMKREFCIVAPDEKAGRFLLSEVMQAGNFGHHDERYGPTKDETMGHRYFRMNRRNLHFVTRYPTEALSEPLLRTWFFFWKLTHRNH